MDKALEVIMVAMILVVAAVVILAMLQGRTGDFSGYTQDRVNSSSCGMSKLRFKRAIDCSASSTSSLNPNKAYQLYDDVRNECAWSSGKSEAYNAVC